MPRVVGSVIHASAARIRVRFARPIGCQACFANAGCGLGPVIALFTPTAQPVLELPQPDRAPWRIGDQVSVTITGSRLALLTTLAFGAPVLAMLAGAMIAGSALPAAADAASLAGAVAGLLAAGATLRQAATGRYLSRVLRVRACARREA